MKVICINSHYNPHVPQEQRGQSHLPLPIIKDREIVTVIDSAEYMGLLFYRFAEYIDKMGTTKWWYDARSFLPLSDIDETEMAREKQLINKA